MELSEYIKNCGEYIGANMWEIYLEDTKNMIHLAESSRLNTLPRFFLNGVITDKDTITTLLKQ